MSPRIEPPAESWRLTIAGWIRAATSRNSYDPRRNRYVLFGIAWGVPIPVFSLFLGIYLLDLPLRPSSLGQLFSRQPWQLFFLAHPIVFAAIFGVLGTLYAAKEEQVMQLLQDLRNKVRELNAANKELQDLDRMKDEFLSNVTHELRTPLVTIQGYNEMLRSGRLGLITDKQRRALEVMHRNQERLLHLIMQLLRYGRMEEHVPHVFQSPFSVRKLFTYLQQNFLPAMRQKEINFEVIQPDEDAHVMGQEDLIEQAMRNLLGNARKFTEKGGRVLVFVDHSRGEGKLGLVVEDNGCGISEDALPYIFERFRQGDGSIRRKYGGTGLGLAIVKKILDAHEAPIRVESKDGEGTRFTIILPLAPRPAAQAHERRSVT